MLQVNGLGFCFAGVLCGSAWAASIKSKQEQERLALVAQVGDLEKALEAQSKPTPARMFSGTATQPHTHTPPAGVRRHCHQQSQLLLWRASCYRTAYHCALVACAFAAVCINIFIDPSMLLPLLRPALSATASNVV
jgi:hypothetical protein